MPHSSWKQCGLNPRSYIDGYQLLQSFTTAGAAQVLQTTSITPSTMLGLTGVLPLDGAEGARFIFARSATATTLTAWLTGFEPILGPEGTPTAYIEKPISSTAAVALTTGILEIGLELNTTNLGICATVTPGVTTIPTAGLWVSSSATLTGSMVGYVIKHDCGTTSGIGHWECGGVAASVAATNPGLQGVTHLRMLLSCATAAQSVFCLAKRIRGDAILEG